MTNQRNKTTGLKWPLTESESIMSKAINAVVRSGHILTYWANPTTTSSVNIIVYEDGKREVINTVLTPSLTSPQPPLPHGVTAGMEQFSVPIASLSTVGGRMFNPKKKNTYGIKLVDSTRTAGPLVEADSTEVDPKNELAVILGWTSGILIIAVIAAVIILRWPDSTESTTTPTPIVAAKPTNTLASAGHKEVTKKVENAPTKAEIKTSAGSKIPPGIPPVEMPPASHSTKKKVPAKAPSPIAPPVQSPLIVTTGTTNVPSILPSGDVVVTNGSGLVVINYGTISGGIHNRSSGENQSTEPVLEWPFDSSASHVGNILEKNACDDKTVTAREICIMLPIGADYIYRYPVGWTVSVDTDANKVNSAFNVGGTDKNPKWVLTRLFKGGSVQSLRIQNLDSSPLKVVFKLTRKGPQ